MRSIRAVLWCTLAVLVSNFCVWAQSQPMQFVPVSPCRLLDTRQSGHPIQGGTFQSYNLALLAQSVGCQSLSAASAYSLNVTVVPRAYLAYLTIWPTGQPRPTISLMNSFDGRTKANAAIVQSGVSSSVNIFVTNTADVILDVNGFFEPATFAAFTYYPLATPCRVADTRNNNGPPLPGGQEHDFDVLGSGCPVPANAQAYALNFTAVPYPSGHRLDYLTVWPAGQPRPTASTLNAPTGTIVANAALIPANGAGGEVAVYPSNDTHLVIDINGYFALASPNSGYAFYTLTPCRALDTRPNQFNGQQTFNIEGSACHPPAAAASYVMNASALPIGPLGYLTLWPSGLRPLASTLNAYDGANASNMAIIGTTTGSINAYASGTTNLLLDLAGYMAPIPSLAITTSSLPGGTTGQPYQAQLAASGGEPPYTWVLTSGSLPAGLTMSIDGRIAGIPTATGTFPITVKVTDQFHNFVTKDLSISVVQGTIVVTTSALPSGTQTVTYSATLAAAGGTPPLSWSIVAGSGSLPDGLSLNANTGAITGTPTTVGTSNFTVQVEDSQSTTAQQPLQIVINPAVGAASLSGHYAFSFNGYNNGMPVFMAGSFTADGAGNVLAGILDLNTGQSDPDGGYPFTGMYALNANGLGTIHLDVPTLGSFDFSIALSSGGGQLIQRNQDPNTRGSGSFFVQSPAAFLPPKPGTYAMGSIGADSNNFGRYANGGVFTVPVSGAITGTEDINDNGNLTNRTLTATFGVPSAQNGRGHSAFMFPNGVTNHYAYYVVSTGQFIIIGTDPLTNQDPLTLGSIQMQLAATFNNAALNGNSILEVSGVTGGAPDVILGLANWNGGGTGTTTLDENRGGTVTQQTVQQGQYIVALNGRVTTAGLGASSPIMYLYNFNQGFVVGQNASVFSGVLEPQTAIPPYGNPSIMGSYQGGTVMPAVASITDAISYFLADGNGNINGDQVQCGTNGCSENPALSASFQVDASGRAISSGNLAGTMYVISNKKIALLPNGNAPVLSTFSSGIAQ